MYVHNADTNGMIKLQNNKTMDKETLEKLKRIYEQADSIGQEIMEKEFPELIESEDECIRKEIINYFKEKGDYLSCWMTWLEKQKETEYSLEQTAQMFLDALSKTPYNNKPVTDAQIITKELLKFLSDTNSYNPDALIEQKTNDYDRGYRDGVSAVEFNNKWSDEDKKLLKLTLENLKELEVEYGEGYGKVGNCISWLKSLKPQPHCKQSEDKKETKNKCPNYSEGYGCSTSPLNQCDTCPYYKLYNHWKPSEKQMCVLQAATEYTKTTEYKEVLISLYNELKKL